VVGQEISDNEKYFLQDPDFRQLPFVVNYKSLSHDMKKLRSSTYFFKNEQNEIEYLLSITANVDEFVYIREVLDVFTNGSPATAINSPTVDNIPKLNLSIHDLIDTVIAEGQKRYDTVVKRMTKMEKQSLIREMHSRGAFLIKGAVTEAATKLDYSETTVYRYLQKLEGK
jgi:predicted transcriptional regulator YheO